uniref:Uncharacterized protein n=1 Tax=Molossus molossus TaxID=27622 RepID=A0A7J8DQ87_MOLMO|nr:hypothetical protein HJG59_009300 [Molossus molossus]
MKSKQMELNIFAAPFNVEPAEVPDNLQHNIIQRQSDDELKARSNLPLPEFYQRSISNDEVPTLRRHALKHASVSEKLIAASSSFQYSPSQSQLRSRLTDANLAMQLGAAAAAIPADTTRLPKGKHFQPSP